MSLMALCGEKELPVTKAEEKKMATKEERNTFSLQIEKMSISLGLTCIEAITHYCEENNLEIEVAASLINENLKKKIESEARKLRFLPKVSKLPL